MTKKLPLLDKIADDLNLLYLSELNSMINSGAKELSAFYQSVSFIRPDMYDTREWNEALHYLFGRPPQRSAEDAKAELLDAVREII